VNLEKRTIHELRKHRTDQLPCGYLAATIDHPFRPLGLAQHGALHKHLHPLAQLRLRLDQARTATAQGAVPPAQPLPQAPHLLLSRAQSRFWALLFIGQSCLVYV
jgi:hypothetical protein